MKKAVIVLALIALSLSGMAQDGISLWKPVPKNLFQVVNAHNKLLNPKATAINSVFIWRLSAMITADELTWNKNTKQFVSTTLSSVGPAIGYRHYTQLNDGTGYNDWGVNLGVLLGTDINYAMPANAKIALTFNAFQFVNVGGAYTFNQPNNWSILIGANFTF